MKNKRGIIILVVLLAIGFAAVSTTLVINGVIGLSFGELDVYYSKAVINGTEDNTVIKDKTHIEFDTTMTLVGEKYEMDYDVTNGSRNYDADIKMECNYETEDGGEYLALENKINTDSLLKAMTTRTGHLTIKMIKAVTEPKDIHITCELKATPQERDEDPGDEITKEAVTLVETIMSKANEDSINNYNAGDKGEVYAFNHAATAQLKANTDYRYIGSSPNNYIMFDNELWRVIGVFEDENGVKRAKIMRADYASLPYQTSSNPFYWNEPKDRTNQDKPSYLLANTNWEDSDLYNHVVKRNITDGGLDHVDDVKFYLGSSSDTFASASQFYNDERGNQTYSSIINPENGTASLNKTYMNGKVGILYASDYFYTYANGVDDICFNSPASCNTRLGGDPQSSWINNSRGYQEHLINTYANGSSAFFITPWGSQYQISLKGTTEQAYIREVVYLKADTVSEEGDGTEQNPYVIESHDTKDYIESLTNGSSVSSSKIEKITFINSNEVPSNAIKSWDASATKNGSIMAYTIDEDGNDMYELYIGKKGKVYTDYRVNSLFSFQNVREITGFENFSTKNAYDFYEMFKNCGSEKLDLRSFDTSMAATTADMFMDCDNLIELDVSGWNTSNVVDMQRMFWGCDKLKKLDLSSWDTSNVTNMRELFVYSSELEEINLHGWNTNKVTNMSLMFDGCTNLKNVDVSTFDTSNVTNMGNMFQNCESLESLDLSNFDTSNVRNMYEMFFKCYKLKNLNISNFIFYGVDANHMFAYCYDLNAVVNFPQAAFSGYDKIFLNTAKNDGAQLTVNYSTSSESFVDYLLNQKDSYPESVGTANVVKGNILV